MAFMAQGGGGVGGNPFAGLQLASNAGGVNYGALANMNFGGPGSYNPVASGDPSGGNSAAVGAYLHALQNQAVGNYLHALQARSQAAPPAAAPAAGPSFLQALQSALTPAAAPQVTANLVTPMGFNNFWDPSAYTNAINGVTAQGAASQNVDNQAFNTATGATQAENALAAKQAAQYVANAQQNASGLAQGENAAVAAAQQAAGSGGLLGAALGQQQSLFNADNARQVQDAQFFQALQNSDSAAALNNLNLSRASATNNLQAAIQGEKSKIGMAESAAQGQAQSRYASYLDQVQRENTAAQNQAAIENARGATAQSTALASNMRAILPMITATAISPDAQVNNAIHSGQIDPNTASAFQMAVSGGKAPDGSISLAPAKSMQDALNRVPGLAKFYGTNPAALDMYVRSHYNTTKQPDLGQLSALLGIGSGS